MIVIRRLTITLSALIVFGVSGLEPTYADGIVVAPNLNANVDGNDNFLSCCTDTRVQQVYAASQFGALGGPQLITQIAFRLDGAFGTAFTYNNPNLKIIMSTTQRNPDGLSGTLPITRFGLCNRAQRANHPVQCQYSSAKWNQSFRHRHHANNSISLRS